MKSIPSHLLYRILVASAALCGCLASVAATEETLASSSSLESKIRGAYFGALMSDALCLGSHYEYDARKIYQAYQGVLTKYMAPGEAMGGETHGVGWGKRNYHPGTVAGDQTDYGEYNILLLEHFSTSKNFGSFSVESFLPLWQKRLMSPDWKQWRCTQTKRALQMHQRGYPSNQLGGPSNAMALRYAAAFAVYDKEDDLVAAARGSMFTHSERTALLGNEFFARLTFRVLRRPQKEQRNTLRPIIEQLASESDKWIQNKVAQAIAKFEEATNPEMDLSKEKFVDDLALTSMARLWDVGKSEPIKVGKASPTEGTLPGALYFILKYEDDLVAAAKANAMVGGDNASRSIAVGMVLGAHHGVEAIPDDLKETLNAWNKCEAMLDTLPLLTQGRDGKREEIDDSKCEQNTESNGILPLCPT